MDKERVGEIALALLRKRVMDESLHYCSDFRTRISVEVCSSLGFSFFEAKEFSEILYDEIINHLKK